MLPEDHTQDHIPTRTLDMTNLMEIAVWLASAITSGVVGNAAFSTVKNIKNSFGKARVDELKDKVYQELKRVKRKPGVANQDLHNRVEALFKDF